MGRSLIAIVLGFALALFVAFAVGSLWGLPLGAPSQDFAGFIPRVLTTIVPYLPFAIAVAVPAIVAGELLKIRNWPFWAFSGTCAALAGYFILTAPGGAHRADFLGPHSVIGILGMGLLGGLVYWLAAGRRSGHLAAALSVLSRPAINEREDNRKCRLCTILGLLLGAIPLLLLGWYAMHHLPLPQAVVTRAEQDAGQLLKAAGLPAANLKITEHVGHVTGTAANETEKAKAFETAKRALAPIVGLPGVVAVLQNDIEAPLAREPAVAATAEAVRKKADDDRLAAAAAARKSAEAAAAKKADDARVAAEAAAKRKAEEAAVAKKKADDERIAAEAAAKRKAEDEAFAKKRAEDDELARKKAADELLAAEAATRRKDEAEAAAKKKAEDEQLAAAAADKKKAEDERLAAEAAAKTKAEEAAAAKKAEEERISAEAEAAAKTKAEEAAAAKTAEEERVAAEAEAAAKKKAEEAAAAAKKAADERLAAEAEAKRKAEDDALLKKAEENRLAAAAALQRKGEEEAAAKKRADAEAAAQAQKAEEDRLAAEAAAKAKADAQSAAKPAPPPAPAPAAAAAPAPAASSCLQDFSDLFQRDDIRFALNSAALTSDSAGFLDKIAALAKHCDGYAITLDGHTDRTGPEAYNQRLSDERAETVRAALVERGVASDHLGAHGYGAERPFAPANSMAAFRLNRRVVLSAHEWKRP